MENKGVWKFWYSIAIAFFLIGFFTDKSIFASIGFFLIIVGNIRSRQL